MEQTMSEMVYKEEALKVLAPFERNFDIIPHKDEMVYVRECLKGIRKGLEALPSADKSQEEWIPCSEKMPEDPNPSCSYGKKAYQVTTANGRAIALNWQKTEVRGKAVMRWEWSDGVIYHGDVLAWKPLSEPWKGADDES